MRNIFAYCLIVVCGILGLGSGLVFGQGTPTVTVTPTPQAPTVVTGEATDIAGSAVLHGTVNAHGFETNAWFEYGTVSSNYSTSTSTETISGLDDTPISISTGSLPIRTGSPYIFYYRIAAENSVGRSYGKEKSFSDTLHGDCLVCYISGKVIDAVTKKGIEDANVNGKFTDADGSYTWEGETYGYTCDGASYTVTASADGYKPSSKTVIFSEVSCFEELNFELQPITCEVKKVKIDLSRLKLKRGQGGEVTITLEGDNCIPASETVTATIGKFGSKSISISSTSEVTDENGEAKFTITAKNKIGSARVTFKADNLKKSIIVKVVRQ